MKIADIFKCIFNGSLSILITISLKFVPKNPVDCKSGNNADPVHRRIYTALRGGGGVGGLVGLVGWWGWGWGGGWGVDKITKLGKNFHWGLVHLVQSASLRLNSSKIFHTVFETLPVGAKSLPILTPDYWHLPQSNFTEYLSWDYYSSLRY